MRVLMRGLPPLKVPGVATGGAMSYETDRGLYALPLLRQSVGAGAAARAAEARVGTAPESAGDACRRGGAARAWTAQGSVSALKSRMRCAANAGWAHSIQKPSLAYMSTNLS